MPSITEKPWFLAVCIPVVILGVGGGMCYLLLHLLTPSHGSGHHDWDYKEGSKGPDHWGEMSPDWAIASTADALTLSFSSSRHAIIKLLSVCLFDI